MENEVVNENQTTTGVSKVTNKCAIASFVCSLVGLLIAGIPCGIAAIITGIVGIVQINKNKSTQKGMWMAIFGLILGSFDFIIVAIALPIMVNEIMDVMGSI